MATWLEPLAAQVTGVRPDDATIAAVVRVLDEPSAPALGRAPPPDALRAAASGVPRDFAAGKLDVAAFTAAIADLTAEEEALDQGEAPTQTVTAAEATGLPRNLPQLWAEAGEKERVDLLAGIHQGIELRGATFAAVHLTAEAERHGLALALPEKVVLARPAGIEPAT